MRVKNNDYSYPVLSAYNNDYLDSKFDVTFNSGRDDANLLYIDVYIELENNELEILVEEKKAQLILHIECSNTSQRELIRLNDYKYRLFIDEKRFSGSLDMNVFIVANIRIPHYSNSKINENIFGHDYSLKQVAKGMILAATITQSIDIMSEKDSLKNLSSIIKVGHSQREEEMMIEYGSDVIFIYLPTDEYKMYVSLSKTKYGDLVLTSVILPALIYILEVMKEIEDDSSSWYRVISKKIETLDYSIIDIGDKIESFQLAQKLLGRPLSKSLNSKLMEV